MLAYVVFSYVFLSLSLLSILYILFRFFVFFFKQKTAYEMRISDWSSDVCSSDLRTSCFIMLLPNDAGLQHAAGGIEWVNRRIDAEFGDCTVKQIGRASCRERVCQYV